MPDPGNPDSPLTVRPPVRNFNEGQGFADGDAIESIGQMLSQEENAGDECGMFLDPYALQAMETSFYQALWHESPSLVYPQSFGDKGPDEPSNKDGSHGSSNSTAAGNSTEPEGLTGFNGQLDSFLSKALLENSCGESDSVSLFKKGLEEASRFLPPGKYMLSLDAEVHNNENSQPKFKGDDGTEAAVGMRREEGESSLKRERRKKNYQGDREEGCHERSKKQLAFYKEEDEDAAELFDRLFLYCSDERDWLVRAGCSKSKHTKKEGNDKTPIDLESLLLLCARAVAVDDRHTADNLLKRISGHSSITGNGTQRCAHYFAKGLEARLLGIRPQRSVPISISLPAMDIIKASRTLVSACPFKKVDYEFAMRHLLNLAEKAQTLHVIDFGIFLYGLRWVELIKVLSGRRGRCVKLRITGIEEPQPGFRPADMAKKTGSRLAKYCERFNVPFEYSGIVAQNWEMIRLEDFNIDGRNEAVAVTCMHRFERLMDETVGENSPRNDVLDLIRKLNPDVFIHCIVNGSFNSALFPTRVREALYQYSTMFDMLETVFNRGSWERQMMEKYVLGPEILNVLACEGAERVRRPETYRQWEKRTVRAGFQQLPLDVEQVRRLRATVKSCFHRDFLIEEDENWLLQGWKGRTLCACCCWIPNPS